MREWGGEGGGAWAPRRARAHPQPHIHPLHAAHATHDPPAHPNTHTHTQRERACTMPPPPPCAHPFYLHHVVGVAVVRCDHPPPLHLIHHLQQLLWGVGWWWVGGGWVGGWVDGWVGGGWVGGWEGVGMCAGGGGAHEGKAGRGEVAHTRRQCQRGGGALVGKRPPPTHPQRARAARTLTHASTT